MAPIQSCVTMLQKLWGATCWNSGGSSSSTAGMFGSVAGWRHWTSPARVLQFVQKCVQCVKREALWFGFERSEIKMSITLRSQNAIYILQFFSAFFIQKRINLFCFESQTRWFCFHDAMSSVLKYNKMPQLISALHWFPWDFRQVGKQPKKEENL